MKFYLISDNMDTLTGMRLAGIEGEVAHTAPQLRQALDRVSADPAVGVVLLTRRVMDLDPALVEAHKTRHKRPLLAEVPDRHGAGDVSQAIAQYVNDAIGLKL